MEQTLPSRKVIVIHSPHSGRAAELPQALTLLRQAGVTIVDVQAIATLDGLPEQGTHWKESGIDVVVAAGGDGLVGSVTAHLVASGLPLGILPLGTANDVARSVGLPLDLQQAVAVIASGQPTAIDIGIAHPQHEVKSLSSTQEAVSIHVQPAKQLHFVHALTVGVNVEFARLATNPAIRQQYQQRAYTFALLEATKTFKPFDVELSIEGLVVHSNSSVTPVITREPVTLCCPVMQVAVVNAPIFGGALQMKVPGASPNDQILDILIVEDSPLQNLITKVIQFFSRGERHADEVTDWHAKYPALLPAERTRIPGIHHVQAKGITIATQDVARDVTLDGELRSHTPVYTRVADERLQVILAK